MTEKESFTDRHTVALIILMIAVASSPFIGICVYSLAHPPTITNMSYTGTLQNMEYSTNGFGDVLSSTLHFNDGANFTMNGYQSYGIGFNYTVSYQRLTYEIGSFTDNVISVKLASLGVQ
jgi:hypothetical protein